MIEQNTNRLWFAVGSIIVGAVIIFMMGDSVGGVVNNVFGGFDSAIGDVFRDPGDITAEREDETYLYAKIREADEAKGEAEIWVRAVKLDDGTLRIDRSSINDNDYLTAGSSDMTGSLIMPDKINGMKIIGMGNGGNISGLPSNASVFNNAVFDGELRLPKYLEYIIYRTFKNSQFTGELNLPDTLTFIGREAFDNSRFSGELKLPDDLSNIGALAFESSQFTGELNLPDALTFIGREAFQNSTFSGELKLPDKLTAIDERAFRNSLFSGQLDLPDSLTSVGINVFRDSTFTGTLDVSNVSSISARAFSSSKIDKVIRGDVPMSDGSSNSTGIHPEAIRLANGSWYDGTND